MEQDLILLLPEFSPSYSWSQLWRDVYIVFHGRNWYFIYHHTNDTSFAFVRGMEAASEKPRGVRVLFSQTSPYKLGTYGTLDSSCIEAAGAAAVAAVK